MKIFYLSVVIGSQLTFLPAAWARLSTFQQFVTTMVIILPYVFTYKTVRSTASVVTEASHIRHMWQYPYDHVLFHPGLVCRTCLRTKPARSKHCRLCNVCIAKHDHHCVWVMNCLGRGNYGLFLGMVMSLGVMLCYGAFLSYHLLDDFLQVRLHHGLTSNSGPHWSSDRPFSQRIDLWAWAFTEDIRIGAVGILAIFTAPLAWGLLFYHIYLIWAGMTTSESFKWDEWKEDVSDGYVFKCMEPQKSSQANGSIIGGDDPFIPWPVSSPQRLVSRANRLSLEMEPGAQLTLPPWEPVQDLSQIINIYDLGFWDNMRDIFRLS